MATSLIFGLRDRRGRLLVEPFGGVTIGFTSRKEALQHARPGDQVVELDPDRPPQTGRKAVPLPLR